MFRLISLRAAGILALSAGMIGSAYADIVYTANPPHVRVSAGNIAPLGLPACQTSDPTVPTSPTLYCYTPGYIWVAYNILPLLQAGNFGQGQTIVIIDAYGSPTIQQDLQTFHDAFFGTSFPAPDFAVECPMGCPKFSPNNIPHDQVGWTFETSLDVEWAHAIAPLAKIRLIVAPTNGGNALNNAVAYAVAHYPGAILSQSFGVPEAAFRGNNAQLVQAHANYQAAVAAGITVLASSGDAGATNGLPSTTNAGYPASDPLVTAVGGTQGNPLGNLVTLTGTCATSSSACTPTDYGAEQVWNEPWAVSAGGGAVSVLFNPPDFQGGLAYSGRAVPDVAYNAAIDGGVLVAYSALGPAAAGFYVVGGTSAGAPQWAGIFALANVARALQSKGPIGYANPGLYSIAQSAAYASAFHDIQTGDNTLAGTLAGFSAGTGYDLATGWGSPNAANLVSALAALP